MSFNVSLNITNYTLVVQNDAMSATASAEFLTTNTLPAASTFMSGGGTVQDYAGFSTRDAFVAWAVHKTPLVGATIDAAGFSYRFIGLVTNAISDLAGWVPLGLAYPDHWAENVTPGTTDMTAAGMACLAYANVMHLMPTTYGISTWRMGDDQWIHGFGMGATIVRVLNLSNGYGICHQSWYDSLEVPDHGGGISKMTIDANRANNTVSTPLHIRASGFSVFQVEVMNSSLHGFHHAAVGRDGVTLCKRSFGGVWYEEIKSQDVMGSAFYGDDQPDLLDVDADEADAVADFTIYKGRFTKSGQGDQPNGEPWPDILIEHANGIKIAKVKCFQGGGTCIYLRDAGRMMLTECHPDLRALRAKPGSNYFSIFVESWGAAKGGVIIANNVIRNNKKVTAVANSKLYMFGIGNPNSGKAKLTFTGNVMSRSATTGTDYPFYWGPGVYDGMTDVLMDWFPRSDMVADGTMDLNPKWQAAAHALALQLPIRTTLQRNAYLADVGQVIYNSTTGRCETWLNGDWRGVILDNGSYAVAAAVTALVFNVQQRITQSPNSSRTYTAATVPEGTECTLLLTTSGTTSYNLIFGSGFATTYGTLATGVTSGKRFLCKFWSSGSELIEISRIGPY